MMRYRNRQSNASEEALRPNRLFVPLLTVGALAFVLLPILPSWTSDGDEQGAQYGYAVANLGDINADGYSDIAVGAPRYEVDAYRGGAVFLFLGGAGGYASEPDWIAGGSVSGMRFGSAIAGIGDVNADGYDDFAIGAYRTFGSGPEVGRVFIYHGSAEPLATTPALVIDGQQDNARLGWSLDGAGDINDDGYDDVVIGAPFYDSDTAVNAGLVLALPGSAEGVQATPLWTHSGTALAAQLGYAVAGVGDVNGDGYDDVLAGAPGFLVEEVAVGAAILLLGGSSQPVVRAILGPAEDSTFGRAVAAAGDVNHDGFADLLVGAPLYDRGQPAQGGAWVYCGGPSPDPEACWHDTGVIPGAQFGRTISGEVDINADGCADILVGAPGNTADQRLEGSVYVYFGSCGGVLGWPGMRADGNKAEAALGSALASLPRANADDSADWVAGAPDYRREDIIVGRVAVYQGVPLDAALEVYLPLVTR